MLPTQRHQCLIYSGTPTPYLPGLSKLIRQKLAENYRCLYLNRSTILIGLRSSLVAGRIDVTNEVAKGSLVLSSDDAHLVDGRFDIDRMLGMLESALDQALNDGFAGPLGDW